MKLNFYVKLSTHSTISYYIFDITSSQFLNLCLEAVVDEVNKK